MSGLNHEIRFRISLQDMEKADKICRTFPQLKKRELHRCIFFYGLSEFEKQLYYNRVPIFTQTQIKFERRKNKT